MVFNCERLKGAEEVAAYGWLVCRLQYGPAANNALDTTLPLLRWTYSRSLLEGDWATKVIITSFNVVSHN